LCCNVHTFAKMIFKKGKKRVNLYHYTWHPVKMSKFTLVMHQLKL
jgi:uncharacterized protein YlaI